MKALRFVVVFILLVSLYSHESFAQLPTCTEPGKNKVYLRKNDTIYTYDLLQPISATNPSRNSIYTSMNNQYMGGLVVSPNLNANGPSPNFYTVYLQNHYYLNGTQWVNTGHKAGYVNLGAGGGYIYALSITGQVWRYDGTKDAQLITNSLSGLKCTPLDLASDCQGNIYVINNDTAAPQLRMYDTSGTFVRSWAMTGYTPICGGRFTCYSG